MRPFLTVALLASFPLAALPSGAEMEEYRVKALFLYNFTQFVEWPLEAFRDVHEPLNICVVAPSPFESSELERVLKGKSFDTHPLVTRQIRDGKEAASCHIIFFSAASVKKGKALVVDGKRGGLLSVGEVPGFAASGGVINFLIKDGRVRLEVNLTSAEREKLRVSAKLLKLADVIK